MREYFNPRKLYSTLLPRQQHASLISRTYMFHAHILLIITFITVDQRMAQFTFGLFVASVHLTSLRVNSGNRVTEIL